MVEVNRIKTRLRKTFKSTQKAWDRFLKPALSVTAPLIGMPAGYEIKIPKPVQALTIILESISGGRVLSLTDLHSGCKLKLKVMQIFSKKIFE